MDPGRPSLVQALADAFQHLPVDARDGAGIALARHYASLIDDAERIAHELDLITPKDDDELRVLAVLKAKVAAQVVASDLGPKFLTALSALGMTPSARAALVKGGAPTGERSDAEAALLRLRARRGARQDGA